MNNTTISTSYEQQAQDFLTSTGASIDITYLKNDFHFVGDKDKRDIYTVTIKRGNRKFTFNFGQSLNKSGFYYTVGRRKTELDRKYLAKDYFKGKSLGLIGTIKMSDHSFSPQCESDKIHYPETPTAYDVLACLQKYDVGTFEDFCGEFGYYTDSKTAEKTYKAVINEYTSVCKLFTDAEIEQLQEIQ